MKIESLPLDDIRIDGGTQMRAELDDETVADYAGKFKAEEVFPALTVFFDGSTYWLADGFHRLFAARRAGMTAHLCEIRSGTKRDAVLYAVGANGQHGKPRSNADKRKAVETLLNDPEWATWSDREIARRTHVHNDTVGNYRRSLSESDSEDYVLNQNGIKRTIDDLDLSDDEQWLIDPTTGEKWPRDLVPWIDPEPAQPRTYTTKHGTVATMNTANIGGAKPEVVVEHFNADTGEAIENVGVTRTVVKRGGIGPNTMMQIRAGGNSDASTQVCIPHVPARAASFITEKFGVDFARSLASAIASHLSDLEAA